MLDDLAHRATGARIDRLERIIRGYVNEVYRVRLDTGAEISVRLRRYGDEERTPDGEVWAIERARSAVKRPGCPESRFVGRITLMLRHEARRCISAAGGMDSKGGPWG